MCLFVAFYLIIYIFNMCKIKINELNKQNATADNILQNDN